MPPPGLVPAARKKIFPSLFALYYGNNIPRDFAVVGYARSRMTDAEFRSRIESSLACRVDAGADCGAKMQQFLQRVHYVSGQYDSIEDFAELDRKLGELEEGSEGANRWGHDSCHAWLRAGWLLRAREPPSPSAAADSSTSLCLPPSSCPAVSACLARPPPPRGGRG